MSALKRAPPIPLNSNEILILPLNGINRLHILNVQQKVINASIKYPAYFKPLGANVAFNADTNVIYIMEYDENGASNLYKVNKQDQKWSLLFEGIWNQKGLCLIDNKENFADICRIYSDRDGILHIIGPQYIAPEIRKGNNLMHYTFNEEVQDLIINTKQSPQQIVDDLENEEYVEDAIIVPQKKDNTVFIIQPDKFIDTDKIIKLLPNGRIQNVKLNQYVDVYNGIVATRESALIMFGSNDRFGLSNDMYLFTVTIVNFYSVIEKFDILTEMNDDFDVVLLEDIQREKKICLGFTRCNNLPIAFSGIIKKYYAADFIVILYKYDPSFSFVQLKVDDLFSKSIRKIDKPEKVQ